MSEIIKSVLCNVPYNGVSLALTNVMFLLMGFELWGPPYLKNNRNASAELVTIAFFFVMAFATILGALTGGFIGDGTGGYKNQKALGIALAVYMIMVIAALIAGFVAKYLESPILFVAAFFVMIFTENFVEPLFLGIMLTFVKPHEREVANSISLFV